MQHRRSAFSQSQSGELSQAILHIRKRRSSITVTHHRACSASLCCASASAPCKGVKAPPAVAQAEFRRHKFRRFRAFHRAAFPAFPAFPALPAPLRAVALHLLAAPPQQESRAFRVYPDHRAANLALKAMPTVKKVAKRAAKKAAKPRGYPALLAAAAVAVLAATPTATHPNRVMIGLAIKAPAMTNGRLATPYPAARVAIRPALPIQQRVLAA